MHDHAHPASATITEAAGSWRLNAQAGIDDQLSLLETLMPGTAAHEAATCVLLALQDSLFVLSEAKAMIEVFAARGAGV